jgi:hypothetical protein
VNTQANVEAIKGRLSGQAASRMRAAAMAGTAGIGVAVAIYRVLRGPDE